MLLVLVFAVLVLASPEPSHRSSTTTDAVGSGVFPSVARPAPAPVPAVPAVRVVPRVVEVRPVPLAEVLPVVDPTEVAAPAVGAATVPVAAHEEVVSSVRPRPYVPPVHTRTTTPVPPPTSSVPPTTPPVTSTPPPTATPPTTTPPPVLCTTGQETPK